MLIMGCESQNEINEAGRRGAAAGLAEGKSKGAADGWNSGYEAAMTNSYEAKMSYLYATGSFTRKPAYIAIVVGIGFILGFALQYLVFSILRRTEKLQDIDRIIYPQYNTMDISNDLPIGGARNG